ncbi:MAG: sugar ABC transporter permease, partial [Clostridiaceae bacterium]|nr:sugar ABC transporter permease [Clostridiaceae bacterium]
MPRFGIAGSKWVGLKHFRRFVDSPMFFQTMRNTIILNVYGLLAGYPLPIIMGIGLNHMRSLKIKKSIQFITFVPQFFSTVIVMAIILQLFDTRLGIINQVITLLGYDPIDVLGSAKYYRHLYVWSGIWQGLGNSAILYIATLAGVDPELHEAAIIDGATIWKRVWHIDIPSILPTIVITSIFALSGMLSGGSLEKTLLLQNSANISVSEIISTYVYRVGIASAYPDFSFGAAVGLFQNVVSLLLIIIANQIAKWLTDTGLF